MYWEATKQAFYIRIQGNIKIKTKKTTREIDELKAQKLQPNRCIYQKHIISVWPKPSG